MNTTFDNITDASLADEIGALDRQAKKLAERLKAAKAEFKGRGLTDAAGDSFRVKASTAVRISLDTSRIKKAMGQAWADNFSRLAEVTTIRVEAA